MTVIGLLALLLIILFKPFRMLAKWALFCLAVVIAVFIGLLHFWHP